MADVQLVAGPVLGVPSSRMSETALLVSFRNLGNELFMLRLWEPM
jgi:hypothetical protein